MDESGQRMPVILVHGIALADRGINASRLWGRIPAVLREAGYAVFFGATGAWTPVRQNGRILAATIEAVVRETGSSQVVVIAHSKGGLDTRAALMLPGVAERVHAVATLSSPHNGMAFCSWLAKSRLLLPRIAAPVMNIYARMLGETPNAIECLRDLTLEGARTLAQEEGPAAVPFVSLGFREEGEGGPHGIVGRVVYQLDSENDGLVALSSTAYGQQRVLAVRGRLAHESPVDQTRRRSLFCKVEGDDFQTAPELIVGLVKELEAL